MPKKEPVLTEKQLERRAQWAELDFDALLDLAFLKNRVAKSADLEKKDSAVVLRDQFRAIGIQGSYLREDGVSFGLQVKVTKTIDRALLILNGVDPDVVDRCTRTSESDPFVSIRIPKHLLAQFGLPDESEEG